MLCALQALLVQAFNRLDHNGDGEIEVDPLMKLLQNNESQDMLGNLSHVDKVLEECILKPGEGPWSSDNIKAYKIFSTLQDTEKMIT